MLSIGIDLGGTNMRAGLVDKNGKIIEIVWRRTPVSEGPEATAQGMAEMVVELQSKSAEKIFGVGIGSPGPLSRRERKIFQTPNLPGFDGFPLGSRVEEISGLKTCLDNDAKCATYGEEFFGVARGLRDFILLTFGTGIGGGVVVGGQMLYGKSDGACELGHITLHPEGQLCKCGNRGCFEQYCSATAVERRAKLLVGRAVTAPDLFDAHANQEPWAEKVLRGVALDLAYATASLVNIFDPQAVIFAGGLFTRGGGPLCRWVQDEIKDRCFKSSQKNLKILASSLQGEAGVLGAASLVFRASAGDLRRSPDVF